MVGKSNMDEFGMGSFSIHSAAGPVRNPVGAIDGGALVSGGSSGGSAVAVATGACVAAIGSDTGEARENTCTRSTCRNTPYLDMWVYVHL